MKAKDISGQAPGGKRTILADVLPLDTPFVVQVFPIYACNFTCKYCTFSIPRNKRGFISDKIVMDFDLLKKCIDELAVFPNKIKTLRFVGMGEPLLHPKIAAMVKYAVAKNVANKVETLTNGSLLTPKLSDALISAGLSRLVISIQGTTAKKYQEISKVNIDFEKFVKNIKYFFDHKSKTKIYIKIVDIALDNKNDEKRFYEIFGDICDTIGIEHASPIFPGVKYNQVLKDSSFTQFGLKVSEVQVCPQPFFTLQINPDGKVVPCYSVTYPAILGDCNNQSLLEIWNGNKYRQFRRKMLDGRKNVCELCANCKIIKHRLFLEDVLDNDAERLKKFYEPFEALIFDFDGVLVDSNQIKKDAYFDIFRKVGRAKEIIDEVLKKNPDDNRYGIINKVLKRLKKEREIQYEDLESETQRYAQLYGERTEKGQIAAQEIKGATESLKRLKKRGYRLFLHSSTTDESIRRMVKKRGLGVYFEKIYGSSRGKKTEVIQIIVEENKLSPERIVSVGDSDSELEAAEKLGIRFIALANQSNDFSERSDLRYVLYNDLTELLDTIDKINKENDEIK